jgi:hypothetical protein
MSIERQEFGHLVCPFLIVMFIVMIFVLFCWTVDLQEYERKKAEKQEWLNHFTPDGLRYTFGEGNRYEIEFKK